MADLEGEYVVHTQQPRFIAKRVYDNSATYFEIVDEIDSIGEFFKGDVSKAAKLMSRLGDWYVAYLKWEEENE